MEHEIPEQEARFLELAIEHELITGTQAEEALTIAKDASPRKPVSFVLLEQGILDGEAIDLVLEAMINLVDEIVEESVELVRKREWTVAIERLDQAVEMGPSNEEPYWKRAESLFEKRLYQEALRDYTTLIELSERKGEAYNRRGVVFSKLGRHTEAIESHLAGVAEDDTNAKFHFDLGTCYHASKELEKAIAAYGEALDHNPKYIQALNNRAIAHLMSRDLKAAQEDWEQALAIDPTRNTVRLNVASLKKHLEERQAGAGGKS